MNGLKPKQVIVKQVEDLKKEAAAKETKKTEKPKAQPQMFDVKIECLLPATLTYRILAMDANEAIKKSMKIPPNNIKHNIPAKRNIRAIVYKAGELMIKMTKNFGV